LIFLSIPKHGMGSFSPFLIPFALTQQRQGGPLPKAARVSGFDVWAMSHNLHFRTVCAFSGCCAGDMAIAGSRAGCARLFLRLV